MLHWTVPGSTLEPEPIDEVIFQYYTNADSMVQDLKSSAIAVDTETTSLDEMRAEIVEEDAVKHGLFAGEIGRAHV